MTVDALTDVAGLRVGHATRTGDGWLTGTTVVLAPEGGAVAAVDVRGGGPGTKETDALDPRNVVQRVDAIVLTGGSAYGLDAASGVMAWLEEQGRGVPVGPDPAHVVPVVPAACVFDLARGGDFRARPDAAIGRAAVEAAAASEPGAPVPEGCVGAGTGAAVGALKGGVGTAAKVLDSGITVAALVVANAVGSVLD
ncbi:P1 family peptidase, partial [Streptomyces sp. A012304]|uniref:P1 family peptidase n=1 Tax=Streptomyces sp. A012304 TaxID=375446 RepID=UPI002230652E